MELGTGKFGDGVIFLWSFLLEYVVHADESEGLVEYFHWKHLAKQRHPRANMHIRRITFYSALSRN